MGHSIAQWEAAVKRRKDICFTEVYLEQGLVKTVIGFVTQPAPSTRDKNKTRIRHVRWNAMGICSSVRRLDTEGLEAFNIQFKS